MDQNRIKNEIARLNNEIADWTRIYRQLYADLQNVDAEIMSRHKTKWALERLLVPVQKLPEYKEPVKKVRTTEDLTDIDMSKMSMAQLAALLKKLRAQT
jgi:hypothetical protein